MSCEHSSEQRYFAAVTGEKAGDDVLCPLCLRDENERLRQELLEHKGTLRDRFAMAALTGVATCAAWDYSSGPCNAAAAERCYAIADAMLAARERKETP